MKIEQEIFKGYQLEKEKLVPYGFFEKENTYFFTEKIMDDMFEVEIKIFSFFSIEGKIVDLAFNEEYTNYRIETQTGEFVHQIRETFLNILLKIRNTCYKREYFKTKQANRITKLIIEKYGDVPEFPWEKGVYAGVFRNPMTQKWYALLMEIDKNKITEKTGKVEILNVKLDENKITELLQRDGIYKAYHMNKKNWLTLVLDDTLKDEEIMTYIEESHSFTEKQKEWIIPANPKFYDVIHCFDDTDTILWKQAKKVGVGEFVFIYVGVPYSAILYKCEVLKAAIPYTYKDENLSITEGMQIKVIKRYQPDEYPLEKLKSFGVTTIRGPRSMPISLSKEMNK